MFLRLLEKQSKDSRRKLKSKMNMEKRGAEKEFWKLEKKGEMRAEPTDPRMRVSRREGNQISRMERCLREWKENAAED